MNKEQIKEINQHISDALAQWADIANRADADEWAYLLDYTNKDLLNALYIFSHVAQNVAIKKDYYKDDKDITEKMLAFKAGVECGFGFSTTKLAYEVLKGNGETKDT